MKYTDSKGREHVIAEMPFPYLKYALAKLERTPLLGGDASAAEHMRMLDKRNKLKAAMCEEIERREAARQDAPPS